MSPKSIDARAEESAAGIAAKPLSADQLSRMNAYWRALNYLSVGQIYLLDNPLLREPLRREHIKPRLLGHWGTSPGLNMLCVHLNRVIRRDDLSVIYIIGPGHGGPSLVAHAYLEGTYSEVYPNIGQDAEGMQRLFRPFQRVETDASRGTRGAGLGLYISRRLVEAHGGRLWVASVSDAGSVFSFTLPVLID